jgi:hypothetical protein
MKSEKMSSFGAVDAEEPKGMTYLKARGPVYDRTQSVHSLVSTRHLEVELRRRWLLPPTNLRLRESAPADQRRRGIAGHPSRSIATNKAHCQKRFYRRRNRKLLLPHEDWRRIATRYDELARIFPPATCRRSLLDQTVSPDRSKTLRSWFC